MASLLASAISSAITAGIRDRRRGARSKTRAPSVPRSRAPSRPRPSSRAPSRPRPKGALPVRNDGNGNQMASSKKGRPLPKLGNKMQSKIRESLNPIDTASMVYTGSSTTTHGSCEYTCEQTVMGATDELNNVIENARNVQESSAQQGKAGKFYMKSYSMMLKLVNATNGMCNLRVYEYICRADVPTNIGTVESILDNGWDDQASPPALPPAPVPPFISKNWVGGSLYQNVGFTPFFRIVKDFKVQLGPGKEFVLSLKNNRSKYLNPVSSNPTHVTCLDGYTRGYIVQHMGQPIGDISDPQLLTTSISKIIWTITKKYNYQQVFDNAGATYELTSQIPQTLTNSRYINQLDGSLQTEIQA